MIVSLGAGPWDALFGGGNVPAFALASVASLAAGVIAVHKLQNWAAPGCSSRTSQRVPNTRVEEDEEEARPRFSFGSLVWSQLERLSSSFGPIRL